MQLCPRGLAVAASFSYRVSFRSLALLLEPIRNVARLMRDRLSTDDAKTELLATLAEPAAVTGIMIGDWLSRDAGGLNTDCPMPRAPWTAERRALAVNRLAEV
jgi:hypothetical protein